MNTTPEMPDAPPAAGPPPSGGLSGWFADQVANVGSFTMARVAAIGDVAIFSLQTVGWLFARRQRRDVLLPALHQIGVMSLPVVALTGLFIGMVLAVQSYAQFKALGLQTRLGSVINLSLVRELGPVLAATMLAGRVGSSMAAELGTMRVTEQIDALECMGANPIYYLVVPRFIGCLLLIPALTIMADFMGVLGGYLYSHIILGIDYHHYWENSRAYVDAFDFLMGIFKSLFFGAAIALVSCHHGFHCGHGAEGVGKAATNAFVHSFVLILLLDLFLGIWLNNVHDFFRPEGPRRLL
jgi:phospholipid/cholesterol/gamma-HCH transport system permease protein